MSRRPGGVFFFFFNDTATTEIYTLSLHDALPILVFSMLSMYCFYTWAPLESFVPGLPGFLWTEFRGLYVWTLPLLVVYLHVAAPSQRGKLPETKWQEVWAFLSRSVQPLKNPPQM